MRWGRDSNPRNSFPFTRFPSVRLKPLGHLTKILANLINYTVISPLKESLNWVFISSFFNPLPLKYISFVIALSVVISKALITPIFSNSELFSYLDCSTLPFKHWLQFTITLFWRIACLIMCKNSLSELKFPEPKLSNIIASDELIIALIISFFSPGKNLITYFPSQRNRKLFFDCFRV